MDFHEILYPNIFFRKSIENIQGQLKYDKHNGYFTWIPMYIYYNIWLNYFWIRKVLERCGGENQNTILCTIIFFSENRSVYEIVLEKYGRARQATDDNIIWRMSFACWIPKDTNTHSEYVILNAFPRKIWILQTHLCGTFLRTIEVRCYQ